MAFPNNSSTGLSLFKEKDAHMQHVQEVDHHGSRGEFTPGDYSSYPNRWAQIRSYIREPAAEFFGTMVLILFGCGVNCQVALSSNPGVAASQKGSYLSVSFGWALGVALGVWVSGGISGGHINPTVTLCMAIFRRFSWKKVPIYWAAQILGAICGAGIVYANYFHAIDIFEGGRGIRTVPGTAGLFATYAASYMTSVSCFFDEFIGTALLLIVLLAATDKGNMMPPSGMLPVVLFILILGIGTCFGLQTGFAINPARDLGPRIMTAMVGYGKEVFTYRNQYWIWCPVMATVLGGICGSFIYDAFLFVGSESIINTPHASATLKSESKKVSMGADAV